MNPLLHSLVALLLLATSAPTTTPSATQPTIVPVAAVWHEISYPPPGAYDLQHLAVGVWSDGKIVWSTSDEHFGPPYSVGRVDPGQVEKLAKDLGELGFFDDPEVNRQPNQYPPDASYTAVAASWKDQRQRLASWRLPPESGGERFKEVFLAAKKRIEQLIPEKGEPLEKVDATIYRVGRKPRR